MEEGLLPREALDMLLRRDRGRDFRQVAMMDVRGNRAVFTGRRVPQWHGESTGSDYVVIGNLLSGEEVIESMAEAFEGSTGDLARRMVDALEAASESGGDRRGERSAALIIVDARRVVVKEVVKEDIIPIRELGRRLESRSPSTQFKP